MGVRDEVLAMFRQGMDPIDISLRRQTTVQTTIQYLQALVGRGEIRRSDVLFSIRRERREPITGVLQSNASRYPAQVMKTLQKQGYDITREELEVVHAFYDTHSPWGDMYDDLRTIECGLHRVIRQALEKRFGEGERGWWRNGVPTEIRQECHRRREEDPYPAAEPWSYTDLKHLHKITDKHWALLFPHLPPLRERDKQSLLSDIVRLNQIRNQIMHPVRGEQPREEDFAFVRELRIRLGFREGVAAATYAYRTKPSPPEATS